MIGLSVVVAVSGCGKPIVHFPSSISTNANPIVAESGAKVSLTCVESDVYRNGEEFGDGEVQFTLNASSQGHFHCQCNDDKSPEIILVGESLFHFSERICPYM